MKLRDLVSDGSLNLLQDIIRNFVINAKFGEDLSYQILEMDMAAPAVDPLIAREISQAIAAGGIKPGFLSALWQFVVNHHPATAPSTRIGNTIKNTLPPPRLHNLPWAAGTDAHDFFLFLYEAPRTKDQAVARWERKTANHLWGYFKDGRMDEYGYRVEISKCGDEETIQIKLCENTTTEG
jgi:hypothetical protein